MFVSWDRQSAPCVWRVERFICHAKAKVWWSSLIKLKCDSVQDKSKHSLESGEDTGGESDIAHSGTLCTVCENVSSPVVQRVAQSQFLKFAL